MAVIAQSLLEVFQLAGDISQTEQGLSRADGILAARVFEKGEAAGLVGKRELSGQLSGSALGFPPFRPDSRRQSADISR